MTRHKVSALLTFIGSSFSQALLPPWTNAPALGNAAFTVTYAVGSATLKVSPALAGRRFNNASPIAEAGVQKPPSAGSSSSARQTPASN